MATISADTRINIGMAIAIITIVITGYALHLEEERHNRVMEQQDDRHKDIMKQRDDSHKDIMKQQDEQFKSRMGFDYIIHKETLAEK